MYVRNLGGYKSTKYSYENFKALRKDGNYWFPHYCKYITWAVIAAVVVTSCTILILYGLSFGVIKFYLWITAFLTCFFLSVFITAPVRLFISSVINTFFRKKKPVILQRRIHFSLLVNPPNPEKKIQVLKFRKYNAHMYTPTPVKKLESRLEDIKYNVELRNLTTDIIAYSFFVLTVFYIVLYYDKSPMIFYTNEVIKDLINGSRADSIPFKDIVTYEKFIEYMNKTLLPALLRDSNSGNRRPKRQLNRRRSSWNSNAEETKLPSEDIKKRQAFDSLNNLRESDADGNVLSRGWTVNPNIKLLGKPRLRQVRVKSGNCKELDSLKARNSECAEDLTLFNIETRTFSLNWEESSPKGLTDLQAMPWRHQSMWETKTVPVFGKFSIYPAGGYVLDLARNIENARIVMDFMHAFQWVDFKTRAIFVEFTLYCVNTNLFSVVTLVMEKPAIGFIIPSYQIKTSKFLFLGTNVEVENLIMIIFFAMVIFFFFLRESVRIRRTSFKLYVAQGFAVIDLTLVFLGFLSILFIILRYMYVAFLIKELRENENNKFVSFILAAFWHSLSIYIEALLVCLASFKLFRLLTFRAIFLKMQATLMECYKHYVDLVFLQLILVIAFAFFFNLALVNYSKGFKTFLDSFVSLIGLTVALDSRSNFNLFGNTPWYLGPLFCIVFICLCTVFFAKIFIAVVCLYFHVVQNTPLKNKYDIFQYLKHIANGKRQKDILHLNEDNSSEDKSTDGNVMRLKGGGNKVSRRKRKLKRIKNFKDTICPEYFEKLQRMKEVESENPEELMKIKLSDFVIKKPYDTTQYRDIADDRAIAIKNLMLMILTEKLEGRRAYREKAMKALFLTYTRRKKNLMDVPGNYFLVKSECGDDRAYDRARFSQIKKIIEDIGREKNVLITEDTCSSGICAVEEKLEELENKLDLLCKKFTLRKIHKSGMSDLKIRLGVFPKSKP